ncbi:citrate lyase [Devosia sp. Root436]|jgi:citrate lyase subunit beta/citryl-CoA lyase|uniref:HpcH/HpaI aldolase/citrate lyase family protein n=1 Tax=Devosia sp. Root436 TaxID=1736537 RepID=UPI0006FCBE5B|nr:aldolase/citrate lyase family protein [Devosia sp. Root436]KQX42517.1 citrate lyase [Devosia sp. Root436]
MIRSLLYVPAHSARFIAKAHERGADAIILDLEDAVPASHKAAARDGLRQSVASVGQRGARVLVRVNADWESQQQDALAACRAGAQGLFIPKARDPAALAALAALLVGVEAELGRQALDFVALIEDPGAVLDARSIARAPRVVALSTGGEDLALALGGRPTPEALRVPKLMVHYAAKAEGLQSYGLLRSTADYGDADAVAAAAREAREHGFDGASCVHPSLVPLLNAGFAPSAEERAWAERVVAAAAGGEGAFSVDGAMVDAPVIARARAILAAGPR